MLGLFLLLALIVSLTLALASWEDNVRMIVKSSLKNFWFLVLMILGITFFAQGIRLIF
jgi:hypothetical protein